MFAHARTHTLASRDVFVTTYNKYAHFIINFALACTAGALTMQGGVGRIDHSLGSVQGLP